MADLYLWLKAFHVIAVIAWMAALFYLPRLFVYHSKVAPASQSSELFKVMEARLARVIMTPAMLASWLLGAAIVVLNGALLASVWFIVKLLFALALSGFHGLLLGYLRAFGADRRPRSERYFRVLNEVPTIAMAVIVVMVIVRPF